MLNRATVFCPEIVLNLECLGNGVRLNVPGTGFGYGPELGACGRC